MKRVLKIYDRIIILTGGLLFIEQTSDAQETSAALMGITNSVTVSVRSSYDDVSGVHRWLFGGNYRRDYAIPVKMPLLRLSKLYGGLKPVKEGGGMESKSLRLTEAKGKEWVMRSVTKIADKLLPENLRGTFVVDWIGDEFSGQHPYSALCVGPLADAAGVPPSNPVIGMIADDPNQGGFRRAFTGMICLLEEREPAGPSDNTIKFEKELIKSYDNRFDGRQFLCARLLDILMADWDRHEDQWRWAVSKMAEGRRYIPVPRDRDQVFHITTAVLPWIASRPWLDPTLENFDVDIPRVRYSLFKPRSINLFPDARLNYEDWMQTTDEFIKAETDEVFEHALRLLPPEIYKIRHDELLTKLKGRRGNLRKAMAEYYKLIYHIADLRTTDKDETIIVSDAPNGGMNIRLEKKYPENITNAAVMDMTYDPSITREVRLYTPAGDDQIKINTVNSAVRLRIVDSTGQKNYMVGSGHRKIDVYGRPGTSSYNDPSGRLRLHLSSDTATGAFTRTNPYKVWMPLATAAINKDEGIMLGLGFRYTGSTGFRKLPWSNLQQLLLTRSFATNAFGVNYYGQWREAVGNADLTISAVAQAPNNTPNFFGQGNETFLNKFPGYRTYFRARYDVYQLDLGLRWRLGKNTTLTAGPSLQLYHMDLDDNRGRSLMPPGLIRSYGSTGYENHRIHLGTAITLASDKRDSKILPVSGYVFTLQLRGYEGINNNSHSFFQAEPSFTIYQKIGKDGVFVLSDRLGGGFAAGRQTFYQSMYLGGQGNLLGYLRNRFSGRHMIYNNLTARLRVADIKGYVFPGQLSMTGFFNTGRVWQPGKRSDLWHHGEGEGVYFAPASMTVIQVIAGHSAEGWYPYIGFNFHI